ncbi:Protein phosphatase 2C [uncultured virus]|nr:Protein phosphatase 2C [uncultured virus]
MSQFRTILHRTSRTGNTKPTNEDVDTYYLSSLNIHSTSPTASSQSSQSQVPPKPDVFVLCDGHGGDAVAKYVAPRLCKYITSQHRFPLDKVAINTIFNKIQNDLITHPKNIASHCGTTALVVIFYNYNRLQVINLGDSRAVICHNKLALPLTKDHKPSWPDEKARIAQVSRDLNTNTRITLAQGSEDWRIGDLSVSRSFGDLDNVPYVSHNPEVFHYKLSSSDWFVVLCCDGVTDVLENHEIVNFCLDCYGNNQLQTYGMPYDKMTKTKNIAVKLADLAEYKGSQDNLTAMVVFFDEL